MYNVGLNKGKTRSYGALVNISAIPLFRVNKNEFFISSKGRNIFPRIYRSLPFARNDIIENVPRAFVNIFRHGLRWLVRT